MLKIDPEFENKIPPLTDAEFYQLEENIVEDGEVYEPIVTWNGVIVDGHNRYKIIQKHPEIPYKIREMDFVDKWAAFEWMYRKQLGRRNLTEENRMYCIGKMYEARKQSVGAPIGNTNAEKQCAQNGNIVSSPARVSEQIAQELGVGKNTVIRAEKFAKGVETIRDVDPEFADVVLSGKANITKTEIQSFAKAEPEQVKTAVQEIKEGKRTKYFLPHDRKNPEYSKEVLKPQIPSDPNYTPEYRIDDLLEEAKGITSTFLKQFSRVLQENKNLVSENLAEITTIIDGVISELEKLEEEY